MDEGREKCAKWDKHQSPIDIDPACLKELDLPPLKFTNHWEPSVPFTAALTGHTVEVRAPAGCRLSVEGGPLLGRYLFDHLHFHWGECDDFGTEHAIDHNKYAMEAHMLYYNEKYPSVNEAKGKDNGLCVISLLFESRKKVHEQDVERLVGGAVEGRAMPPAALQPLKDTLESNNYYTYEGSLTTEPFFEKVTWIIFSQPKLIASCLVTKFRKVKSAEGEPVCSNCRPVQPLHGRTVSVVRATESSGGPCSRNHNLADYLSLARDKLSQIHQSFKAILKDLTKCKID